MAKPSDVVLSTSYQRASLLNVGAEFRFGVTGYTT